MREAAGGEESGAVKPIICVGHAALDYVYRIEAFPPRADQGALARAHRERRRHGGQRGRHDRAARRPRSSCGAAPAPTAPAQRIHAFLEADGVDIRFVRTYEGARSSTSAVIVDGKRRPADRRRARPRHVDGRELAAARAHRRRRRGAERPALGRRHARGIRRGARRAACRRCSTPTSAAAAILSEFLCLADYAIFSGPALDAFAPGRRRAPAARPASCALGVSHAGVTRGADGLHLGWRRAAQAGHQPAFASEVVDTTGAGDAFHGAFAWALADGRSAAECARIAAAVSALKCRRLGRPLRPADAATSSTPSSPRMWTDGETVRAFAARA